MKSAEPLRSQQGGPTTGPITSTADQILQDVVSRTTTSTQTTVLGICGPPGAGKTYAADAVKTALNSNGLPSEIIPMDGFHLSMAQLERLGLSHQKGAPNTFDVHGFLNLLERIRTARPDEPVYAPDYDRNFHEPVAARIRVDATTRIVIIEGNYLLLDAPGWRALQDYIDISWYLDTPESLRDHRLIDRQASKGKTHGEATAWVNDVDHANATLIAQTRSRATYSSDATLLNQELRQFAEP